MPEQFKIILSRQAIKYYRRLPINVARRLDRAFLSLEKNPIFDSDIKQLKGKDKRYRSRAGDLRIIYQLNKKKKLVMVSTILPRGQVYKKRRANIL